MPGSILSAPSQEEVYFFERWDAQESTCRFCSSRIFDSRGQKYIVGNEETEPIGPFCPDCWNEMNTEVSDVRE